MKHDNSTPGDLHGYVDTKQFNKYGNHKVQLNVQRNPAEKLIENQCNPKPVPRVRDVGYMAGIAKKNMMKADKRPTMDHTTCFGKPTRPYTPI